jgi:hypothetical protein
MEVCLDERDHLWIILHSAVTVVLYRRRVQHETGRRTSTRDER